jgi:hypothetical protein
MEFIPTHLMEDLMMKWVAAKFMSHPIGVGGFV